MIVLTEKNYTKIWINGEKLVENKKRRYYEKTQNSRNKGNKYTLEEIKMILDKNYSDTELSQILGRSVKAIQVKRCKLNLESEDLNNE